MTIEQSGAVFGLAEIEAQRREGGRPFHEFLRVAALSVGLYRLEPGEPDRQRPHSEDEIYYVVAGEGAIAIADERRTVRPGDTIYVAKGVEHHFYDYPAGLTLLVVFAPAEGNTRG